MQLKLHVRIYFMHLITNIGLKYFGIGYASKARLHKRENLDVAQVRYSSLLLIVCYYKTILHWFSIMKGLFSSSTFVIFSLFGQSDERQTELKFHSTWICDMHACIKCFNVKTRRAWLINVNAPGFGEIICIEITQHLLIASQNCGSFAFKSKINTEPTKNKERRVPTLLKCLPAKYLFANIKVFTAYGPFSSVVCNARKCTCTFRFPGRIYIVCVL